MGERGRKAGRVVPAGPEGDPADRRERFDRWFDPCVDVAFRILHDPEEAADTVQAVFSLNPPRGTPFGTWALRSTRDEALNRLGRRWRPGGSAGPGLAEPPDLGDESIEVAWAANAALGASDASVLDLHLRHGFGVPEVAGALGISANEAHQLLFRLKRRLGAAVRAWGLWSARSVRRPDRPGCDGLEVAIEGVGERPFGPEVVRAVTQHAKDCRTCQHHQPIQGSPEAVFAAAPILPAGSVLRERVRAALEPQPAPPPAAPAGPAASAASPFPAPPPPGGLGSPPGPGRPGASGSGSGASAGAGTPPGPGTTAGLGSPAGPGASLGSAGHGGPPGPAGTHGSAGSGTPPGPGAPAGPGLPAGLGGPAGRGVAGTGAPPGPGTPAGPEGISSSADPSAPLGPGAPAGPGGTRGPSTPGGPGTPAGPGGTRGTAGPSTPGGPGGTRGPSTPGGPGAPAGPDRPGASGSGSGASAGPAGVDAPAGPGGPAGLDDSAGPAGPRPDSPGESGAPAGPVAPGGPAEADGSDGPAEPGASGGAAGPGDSGGTAAPPDVPELPTRRPRSEAPPPPPPPPPPTPDSPDSPDSTDSPDAPESAESPAGPRAEGEGESANDPGSGYRSDSPTSGPAGAAPGGVPTNGSSGHAHHWAAGAYRPDREPPPPPPPRNGVNGTNGYRTGEHPAARGHGANGTNGAGGYATGERPAVRPGGAYRTGENPAVGGAARHMASGEWHPGAGGPGRKAPADYKYRRLPRTDRRQVLAVGLALVLVFAVSLAIVNFTQGEQGTPSRSDAPVTSVPPGPGESTVPSSVPVPGSPGPQAPGPTASTTAPQPQDDSPAVDGGSDAAAPEIGRFGPVDQGLGPPCEATDRRITLAWESTGATSARIEGPGAPTGDLPASGQATACRAPGPPETYTLTVTGPGGSTFRTTSV